MPKKEDELLKQKGNPSENVEVELAALNSMNNHKKEQKIEGHKNESKQKNQQPD